VEKHTVGRRDLRPPELAVVGIGHALPMERGLGRVQLLDQTGVVVMVSPELVSREKTRKLFVRQRHEGSRLKSRTPDE
jgi:hypothetical protein